MPSVFDTQPTKRPCLLTTSHLSLKDLKTLPPIKGLPPGRYRLRLRADELIVAVFVRNKDSIRKFAISLEADDSWTCGPELAANWTGESGVVPAPDPATTDA